MNFTKIVTHDATFHADDLIACAMLDIVCRHHTGQYVPIIRTRDQEYLSNALVDPSIFVVDVGFQYEPEKLNFDHHQDAELPSAAGLIWRHFKDIICPEKESQPFFEEFIASIDAIDTNRGNIYATWDSLPSGFRHTSHILGGYNRDPSNADMQYLFFYQAKETAVQIIKNELYAAQVKADSEAQYANRTILLNNVAVFDAFSTIWKQKGDHLFVVMPHATGWQLQTRDAYIEKIPESAIEWSGCTFRHVSGFMAVFSSREEAIAFASTLPARKG